MFTTAEDFNTQPYDLPNLTDVPTEFPLFITAAEDRELYKILGVTFYDAFKAGVEALPEDWDDRGYIVGNQVVYSKKIYTALLDSTNIIPTSDPDTWEEQADNRWLLLRDGANYSDSNNHKHKWLGIKSVTVPMIYSLWLRYGVDNQISGSGNVKPNTENSVVVSPNVRIVDSWNEFVLAVNGCWLRRFPGDLYGYLYNNAANFDDVTPEYSSFLNYLAGEFHIPGRQNVLI